MCAYPECPICLDIYGIDKNHIKAPKTLICGDSLCKECLEGIIKRSTENYILCPLCRDKIEKKSNIDDYTNNKQLIKLVNDAFHLQNDETENSEKSEKAIAYNIISLGSSGVGKTSIFKRLLNEKFEQAYQPTIYLDVSIPYFVKYKGQKYKLFFYDSGGQEKFMESLPKSYMRKSDGVLFVFDLTNKQSFEDLEKWYEIYKNEKEYVVGVLLGNKCDMPSQIDQNEIKKFAKEHEFEYLETSSKLDKKIKKAIATLLEGIVESKAHYDSLNLSSDSSETFELDSNKFKKESFCKRFCNKLANLFS